MVRSDAAPLGRLLAVAPGLLLTVRDASQDDVALSEPNVEAERTRHLAVRCHLLDEHAIRYALLGQRVLQDLEEVVDDDGGRRTGAVEHPAHPSARGPLPGGRRGRGVVP